jgi:hypothetical protein
MATTSSLVSGSVVLSSNAIRALATGNAADNAIVAQSSNIFSNTAALANQQVNDYAPVLAVVSSSSLSGSEFGGGVTSNFINADVTGSSAVVDSQINVDLNQVLAQATGVTANNAIDLTSSHLTVGDGQAASILGVDPSAGVVLGSNQQLSDLSAVYAITDGGSESDGIYTSLPSVSGSAISRASNRIEALAQGTSVANSIALAGTKCDTPLLN